MSEYINKFQDYFNRPVAVQAAASLKDSCRIGLEIMEGSTAIARMLLVRKSQENHVIEDDGATRDLTFTLTRLAAEEILANPSDDIGTIGVEIAKLIVSSDPERKVHIQLHSGFLTLMTKGYLGVISTGGKVFGSFLASRGLSGLGALKKIIEKLKG